MTDRTISAWFLNEEHNWGDIFTPFLFENIYGIAAAWERDLMRCDVLATGSILDRLDDGYTGTVLGAGLLNSHAERRRPYDLTKASVPLLRGLRTRERCLTCGPEPMYGDPGILAYLFAKPTVPIYPVGIIPHYLDKKDEQVLLWHSNGDAAVIDIQSGVQNVIDDVAKCGRIVSSALHGLVIADALGIPNHVVRLADPRVWQKGFKFYDYYSAYGEEPSPVRTIDTAVALCKTRDTSTVKRNVRQAFDAFAVSVKP